MCDLKLRKLVGCVYVPSTARSFREGTPFTVPCEGREEPSCRPPRDCLDANGRL